MILSGKLVKTLKVNKLLICRKKLKLMKKKKWLYFVIVDI